MMEKEEAKSAPSKSGLARPLAKGGITAAGVLAVAALIHYLAKQAGDNRGIQSKPPQESQVTDPLDKPVGQSFRPLPTE